MSDAVCGPANPLQQFKQQSQLDRTLQQDRLTSRHSPSQGFRSANPNAGLLDPEFEAFQAGVPPGKLPQTQTFQQPQQISGGPAQAPSWANDFQQMHISSPPPFQQQAMPLPGPSTANWAQGFREQIAQTPPRTQTSASTPQQFQQMARFGGFNGLQSNLSSMNMPSTMQSKGKEPAVEQFDEAAFERAFDQARSDMVLEAEEDGMNLDNVQTEQRQALASQEDMQGSAETEEAEETKADARSDSVPLKPYQQQLMELEQMNKKRLLAQREEQEQQARLTELQREADALSADQFQTNDLAFEREGLQSTQDPHQIRQDTMEEQTESQERAQEDDDALALTAQELLDKVQHNQTDKFRNSQFLGLMRKLRDREVKVEGDQMVETNSATTTSAATETQLNSPSAIPQFDNSEQRPAPLTPRTVDTRPYEYGIPHEEQDHDAGRQQRINHDDGRDVVDMLNQPGAVTDDIGTSAFDSSPPRDPETDGLFDGESPARNDGLSDMLYGEYGTVSLPPH